jgi:Protein of unknown function (DUF3040)
MPLSEDEQRILHQIEQQFYASDPAFADELENHSVYAHCLRQMRWAGFAFVAGLVVLIAALITNTSFLVAFVGFVLMLAATLWFERSFRKMGRAGMQQLSRSLKTGSVREYLGTRSKKVRERFKRDDE